MNEGAELFLKKQESIEINKPISTAEAIELLKKIEQEFDVKIIEKIKEILSHRIDSFTINKDQPYGSLYMGNGSEKISIIFRTTKGETKLLLPKSLEV
jgi:hypothetical protein